MTLKSKTLNPPFPAREVVPHEASMVLIDEITAYGDDFAEARLRIRPDSLFQVGGGHVPSWVGIEFAAQTIAALAGIFDRLEGRAPRIGFVLGIRRMELRTATFRLGQVLRVRVRTMALLDNLATFEVEIQDEESSKQLVVGRMSVYQVDDPEVLLADGRPGR